MSRRAAVLVLVAAMASAACGSRVDEPSTIAGGGGGTAEAGGGGGGGGGGKSGPPADPEAPCGPGDASGATDTGVTDDTISIATIQDIGGPRPGLFQANLDAMQAFVAYCNDLGGVLGRELELVPYDSRISEHRSTTAEACNSAFAIVGQSVAIDSAGAQVGADCGIPDIPAFAVETQHAGAVNVVQPLPNPPEQLNVGPERYVKQEFPDAAKHAAMFYISAGPSSLTAEKRVKGFEEIGFNFDVNSQTELNELNWGPFVEQIRSNDVQYVTSVSELDNPVNLAKELRTQGVEVEIFELDQIGYDPALIEKGGDVVEGVHVVVSTVPFEEADTSDEMQRFLFWLEETDAKAANPSALSVQGWSAGQLFATAAKNLGSDLTRTGLLEELRKIKEWDGHGIHAPANPGDNQVTQCFIYLKVEGGEFVREFPKEGFSCDEKNVVEVQYDFPKGAGT
ncbi:MAG TPA: ABC transporter substrate-binding protein [Acidimicrobiia bacterium]|nr:ABC transporter substrate-binding protein [Acidimicrobiia bacterium]